MFFSLQIVSASLSVHLLDLRSENFLSIKKVLLKKTAQNNYKDVVAKTFLLLEFRRISHKDDVFGRARISRPLLAMVPEINYTGNYRTNHFHFRHFELGSAKITREGAPVGAAPIDVSSSQNSAYFTNMKSPGFEHYGNEIILDVFLASFCLAFQLTADLLIGDGTINTEFTRTQLGLKLQFAIVTGDTMHLIAFGEKRSVVFVDRNSEVLKNSIIFIR